MKIPILSPILFVSLMLFACEDAESNNQKKEEIEEEVVETFEIPCLKSNNSCKKTIELKGTKNYTFDVFTTHPLDSVMSVKDAIIFVHGKDRNASEYFKTMVTAMENLEKTNDVVVIAPYFKNIDEVFNNTDIYWSYLGWRYGNNSQPSDSENRHSSFSIIDTLINKLANTNHFPNLKQIFIAGHSAGAQFSQLYSAGNSMEEKYTNINFGYWIANSQFFLYTNPNRWSDTDGDFIVPDESLCQGYDEYPRGMVDRNTFMNKLSSEKIIQNISKRKVTLLLGEEDVTNSALTTTCYAMLLGKHRYDRGQKYFAFLNKFYPNNSTSKVNIPNADHDKDKVYLSQEGLNFILSELNQ